MRIIYFFIFILIVLFIIDQIVSAAPFGSGSFGKGAFGIGESPVSPSSTGGGGSSGGGSGIGGLVVKKVDKTGEENEASNKTLDRTNDVKIDIIMEREKSIYLLFILLAILIIIVTLFIDYLIRHYKKGKSESVKKTKTTRKKH